MTPHKDHEQLVHEFGIDVPNRELYLVGEPTLLTDEDPGVEYMMASRIIRNLRMLVLRGDGPILIHMKSCGGYETEGFAIYDTILSCPCHVTILSYTHARSISSIILQAADHRVLMPSSYFMFHRGTLEVDGDVTAVQSYIQFSKLWERQMLDIYTAKMKQKGKYIKWSEKRIRELIDEEMNKKVDVYLTAQEAVDWGLADCVFDGNWKGLKE